MPLWGREQPEDRHQLSTGIFAPPVTENKVRKDCKNRSWRKRGCSVRKLSPPSVQACSCAAGNESLTTRCVNREEHIKQHNATQTYKYQEMLQAEALLQSRKHACAALGWHRSRCGCTMYPSASSDMRATASDCAGLTEIGCTRSNPGWLCLDQRSVLPLVSSPSRAPAGLVALAAGYRAGSHRQPGKWYLCLSAVRINSV